MPICPPEMMPALFTLAELAARPNCLPEMLPVLALVRLTVLASMPAASAPGSRPQCSPWRCQH